MSLPARLLPRVALALCAAGPAAAGPRITDIHTDKARYNPGAPVIVSLTLTNPAGGRAVSGGVGLSCQHLDSPLKDPGRPRRFRLAAGASRTLTFRWQPPARDYQGYRIEAWARDTRGYLLDSRATAADVSSSWLRFPRCGFLTTFAGQSRAASAGEVGQLARYHLNSLQFYDWLDKHQAPLAGTVSHPAASWPNLNPHQGDNRRQTILDLIAAAHAAGMACLNYDLIYGAWSGYASDGVDSRWGLYNGPDARVQDSLPMPAGWMTPAIYLFNPGNAGWRRYLIGQEARVFAAYPFDGWQVDQVGERGLKYDATGQLVTVWQTFRPFLNSARASLHKSIVFNNVGAYGLFDTAAHSTEDAVYVECWESAGQATYNDLRTVIDQARDWSGGKAVILAAYPDRTYLNKFTASKPGRFNPPGVLLADAAIFASGGSHIELGDGADMAGTEYWPNHNLIPGPELREALRAYYDFAVAYENLLRGGLHDTPNAVTLSVPSGADAAPNAVWAFARAGGGRHVLHLINLVGERSIAWRDDNGDDPAPIPQTNVVVTYHYGSGTVGKVFCASPDWGNGKALPLAFTVGADARGRYVRVTVPRLRYWDMVSLAIR